MAATPRTLPGWCSPGPSGRTPRWRLTRSPLPPPSDSSTPEHPANILGFDIDEFEDDTFEHDRIGFDYTKNRARVYHGILQKGHKLLEYITVAKVGVPEEAKTSSKPGNRGKLDSHLVVMGTTIASTTGGSSPSWTPRKSAPWWT